MTHFLMKSFKNDEENTFFILKIGWVIASCKWVTPIKQR